MSARWSFPALQIGLEGSVADHSQINCPFHDQGRDTVSESESSDRFLSKFPVLRPDTTRKPDLQEVLRSHPTAVDKLFWLLKSCWWHLTKVVQALVWHRVSGFLRSPSAFDLILKIFRKYLSLLGARWGDFQCASQHNGSGMSESTGTTRKFPRNRFF